MSLQTSIAKYFNVKKRPAADEIKVSNSNKVLILDKNSTDVSSSKELKDDETNCLNRRIIFSTSPKVISSKKSVRSAPKVQRKTPKNVSTLSQDRKFSKPLQIRKSLLSVFENTAAEKKEQNKNAIDTVTDELVDQAIVPFEVKGILSPKKRNSKQSNASVIKTVTELGANLSDNELIHTSKDSDFKEIRSKLIKSKRLEELKKSLKEINDGHSKLDNIQNTLSKSTLASSPTLSSESQSLHFKSCSLKQFEKIEIEVNTSPTKTFESPRKPITSPSLLKRAILMSPGRPQLTSSTSINTRPYISPRKLFTEYIPPSSPVKAFERFSSLSSQDRSSLILPFKYRSLAEIFRSVDTIVSMLSNRRESVSFSKLKTSVQQLSKKNLSKTHIGQILTVFPDAFTCKQEKVKSHLGPGEMYELVITPVLNEDKKGSSVGSGEVNSIMTPSILLERKRKFYNALLERTKDYHENFLKSLDPPLILDRNKLTRWHPDFDVDSVPNIEISVLPEPPNTDKFSSARDVLHKAREMFACNPRMERALQQKEIVSSPGQSENSLSQASQALASALKGIPKSLIEKVRARQAAKAVEMLTRDPAVTKKRLEMTRLPELSRILRNLFVGEKKNVLPLGHVLNKVKDSYRETLTLKELEYHIDLIMEASPGWLFYKIFNDDRYLKMVKQIEMSKVFKDIEKQMNQF